MELYKDEKFMKENIHKSNRELAKELNCAHSTIKTWRQKLQIQNPRHNPNKGNDTFKNKEWLTKAYEDIGNASQIARICGVSNDTIEYWRNNFKINKSDKWRDVNRKYSVDHSYFNEIDSENKAYWLGFAMADGCVTRTELNCPYNRFEFNLKESDFKHLEKLNRDLKSDYPIKMIHKENVKRGFSSTVCNLRISSSLMVNDLMKNGITPNKTGNEHIPASVPEHLMKHFIRGFLDGDGTISLKKTAGFCSSSRLMIQQLKDFIEKKLNITCNITCSKDNIPIYVISYSKTKAKILLDYLYKNSSIYLDRKYERYIKLFCPPVQQCTENKSLNCGNQLRAFSPKLSTKDESGQG